MRIRTFLGRRMASRETSNVVDIWAADFCIYLYYTQNALWHY